MDTAPIPPPPTTAAAAAALHEDDPLVVLEQEARAVAHSFGVAASADAAAALVDRFVHRLGGTSVSVPRRSAADRERINAEIRRRFNGTNVREIARDLALSERHVRRVLGGRKGRA
jgi:Mor family transcriptional regulator